MLSPDAITYLLDKAADEVRRIGCLVAAITEGDGKPPPRTLGEEIKQREEDRERVDREINAVEERSRVGQLNVARALRELQPLLDGWSDALYGNTARAREVLR